MILDAISKITQRRDLSFDEAAAVMDEIMGGNVSPVQTAAFLAALSAKGETVTEIAACAGVMRRRAARLPVSGDLFEIVGTGGDRSDSFNISTTASIVIASGGVAVAKHGNRAASSQSGSADVLEALGVNIRLSPEECARVLERAGICFLFAQQYHTSMRHVAPVRKELGIRTIFNLLGPLTNPGGANMQVLGVSSENLVRPLGGALKELGVRRGMVVYGRERLDELSPCGETVVYEFGGGPDREYTVTASDFGFSPCERSDLRGGTPAENARITLSVLRGEKGPRRDTVLLNAGAGLCIGGKADNLNSGIALASSLIDSGKAYDKLESFIKYSNGVAS